jgi:hypothetical protein
MSEKLLTVPLSELGTVRLVCRRKDCGGVFEMPVERLPLKDFQSCPVCQAAFKESDVAPGHLANLGSAIKQVLSLKDTVEVQFVLKDQD